jgi:hypothetical protein
MDILDAFVPMNKPPGRMAVRAGLNFVAHISSQMKENSNGNSR